MSRRLSSVRLVAMLAIASIAAPALSYSLVSAGRAILVAASPMSVAPAISWNRIPERPGRHAERWTLDGAGLNAVTFYAGIKSGMALFRKVDRHSRPLPRFSASMLSTDVVQFFESSYRVAGGSVSFTVDDLAPAQFAGRPGFRFGYSFTQEDDGVRRKGEATGGVIDGRLYLITYEAPAIHYFAYSLGDYRTIVGSARLWKVE
ncbi:hypothetical protein [uncultured Sphingomonas sp.]|uniref:hypothetical protein n=1 Tax=uncultured Sphingomonas sp. TaxID=158754 RepID=UPI0035CBC96B